MTGYSREIIHQFCRVFKDQVIDSLESIFLRLIAIFERRHKGIIDIPIPIGREFRTLSSYRKTPNLFD